MNTKNFRLNNTISESKQSQLNKYDYIIIGTCAMGWGKKAVVSDQLRVHGVESLRIADTSIMPSITSGNTNAPTMMIAEFAAV